MTVQLERPADVPAPSGPSRGQRIAIIAASAVTLLLAGFIAGFLIRLPGQPAPPPDFASVDVGFCQDMSVHHQQAVLMASWERDHSTDPQLRLIATDIEQTQNNQIGRMQGWLQQWSAPSLPTGPYMTWMVGAPAHTHGGAPVGASGVTTMPGMASADELRALKAATGTELDVLWLQLMLRHHEGGASMLSYAAERATEPEVRSLAGQILTAQEAESAVLTQLLTERGGSPLPLN